MKVKSESEVAQSYPTLRDSMDCSLPGSSVHGILQARVLECVAITFSAKEIAEQSQYPRTSQSVIFRSAAAAAAAAVVFHCIYAPHLDPFSC